MEDMDIKFYSLEEVAEILGINYQLVYKLVKSDVMPSVRIGKLFRITDVQLREYVDKQSQGSPASGNIEHICSLCGKKYFSALSISGSCKECGAPLCKACIENDGAEFCEVHKN